MTRGRENWSRRSKRAATRTTSFTMAGTGASTPASAQEQCSSMSRWMPTTIVSPRKWRRLRVCVLDDLDIGEHDESFVHHLVAHGQHAPDLLFRVHDRDHDRQIA